MISNEKFERNNELEHDRLRLESLLIKIEHRRDEGKYDKDPRMRTMADHFIEQIYERLKLDES